MGGACLAGSKWGGQGVRTTHPPRQRIPPLPPLPPLRALRADQSSSASQTAISVPGPPPEPPPLLEAPPERAPKLPPVPVPVPTPVPVPPQAPAPVLVPVTGPGQKVRRQARPAAPLAEAQRGALQRCCEVAQRVECARVAWVRPSGEVPRRAARAAQRKQARVS